MSDTSSYVFMWIGWCKEDNHDKVWGFIRLKESGAYYNFWGGRGKALRFKRHEGKWDLDNLVYEKVHKKGYRHMSLPQIEVIWPGFEEGFASQFIMAKLSGKILTDPDTQ